MFKAKEHTKILVLIAQRGGSQGIVFLSTLFAARYISPAEFGQVGLFTSLCSFFAMASSLRFEIRGLVCKSELSRERFFGMAYLSNACWFVATMGVVGLCQLLGDFPTWLWLVPLGIVFSSVVQFVLPAQHSSVNQLPRLGWMTQIVAAVTAGSQIAGALLYPVAIPLIFGRLLAWATGVALMAGSISRGLRTGLSLKRKVVLRKAVYARREIIYGVPASVISVATLQVPVYIFSLKSMPDAVGKYWLAFNLIFTPYLIISSSIRPLFLRSVSALTGSKNAYPYIKKVTFASLALGLVLATALVFLCTALTTLALPPEWEGVQYYVMSLALMTASLAAQTPISFSVSAFNLQRINFVAGLVQVAVRALTMIALLEIFEDPIVSILGFSIVSAGMYAIYIYICLRELKYQPTGMT